MNKIDDEAYMKTQIENGLRAYNRRRSSSKEGTSSGVNSSGGLYKRLVDYNLSNKQWHRAAKSQPNHNVFTGKWFRQRFKTIPPGWFNRRGQKSSWSNWRLSNAGHPIQRKLGCHLRGKPLQNWVSSTNHSYTSSFQQQELKDFINAHNTAKDAMKTTKCSPYSTICPVHHVFLITTMVGVDYNRTRCFAAIFAYRIIDYDDHAHLGSRTYKSTGILRNGGFEERHPSHLHRRNSYRRIISGVLGTPAPCDISLINVPLLRKWQTWKTWRNYHGSRRYPTGISIVPTHVSWTHPLFTHRREERPESNRSAANNHSRL